MADKSVDEKLEQMLWDLSNDRIRLFERLTKKEIGIADFGEWSNDRQHRAEKEIKELLLPEELKAYIKNTIGLDEEIAKVIGTSHSIKLGKMLLKRLWGEE